MDTNILKSGLPYSGIAALSVTFFFRKRKVTKRKLPAAPASMVVSAVTSGVVAEPDDAGFGWLTVGLCFWLSAIRPSLRAKRGNPQYTERFCK